MMVKGKIKENRDIEVPDVNYRALKALNYSMIAKYETSPADFVKEFILGEPADEEDSTALIMGNVIDDILLTYKGSIVDFESNFDAKYALYTGEVGTKQVFILADELFSVTKRYPDEDFSNRFRMAFENVQKKSKYKGKKVEFALDDFEANAADYFDTKIKNIGKIVVSEGILEKSTKIAKATMLDAFTMGIYDFGVNSNDYTKLAKLPITFKFTCSNGEIEGKCEVDMLDVDYVNKEIIPRDTKSTYDNTLFPYNYLKNRYYLQAGWYTLGIICWAKENGLDDYKIRPFEFNVLDTSKGGRRPLIYRLDPQHIKQAWEGFTKGDRKFKGINELVGDIVWSNETGEWGISKKAFDANGVINLEI